MKRLFLVFLAAVLACSSVVAQHEQMHVFRNDGRKFNSYKFSEVEKVSFGADDSFSVLLGDGSTLGLKMSAVDSVVTRLTGVPDFHVNLIDYPEWTDLKKDATHTKETVYAAMLRMDGNGMYPDLLEQQVEFRGRGNTTWNMEKTPYRFKMQKKASVCSLPKAKTFALIANYIDCTLMRNVVALKVARMLGLPFTNHAVPVNVWFNGNFKGAYILTEKIGIGSGSVDIDEYRGILFELDTNYDEDYRFQFTWGSSKRLPVMVKDPDMAEVADSLGISPQDYFSMWKDDFTAMARAVVSTPPSGSLRDVIDLDQAVDFFFVQCLAANREMEHPKSLYLHKDSIGDVYHFGPVWDFDWAYTFHFGEKVVPERPLIEKDGNMSGGSFAKLIFANQEFRELFRARLESFIAVDYPALCEYMDAYASLIEPAAKANGVLWPRSQSSYLAAYVTSTFNFRANYAKLRDWLDRRLAYMSSHPNFGLY